MEHEVEGDEDEGEDPGERDHENLEGVISALDGQGHGNGDDLCADHLVQLPAESIRRTIEFDHGLRSRVDGAVAVQAGGVPVLQGGGRVYGAAARRVPAAPSQERPPPPLEEANPSTPSTH